MATLAVKTVSITRSLRVTVMSIALSTLHPGLSDDNLCCVLPEKYQYFENTSI